MRVCVRVHTRVAFCRYRRYHHSLHRASHRCLNCFCIRFAPHFAAHFFLDGIEKVKRGEPKVDVTFEIDANGLLHVTAFDKTTKSSANITITASAGHRSAEEIEKMVEEAEKMKGEDAARLAHIEARNELESYCYHARQVVKSSDNDDLSAVVSRINGWLQDASEATPTSMFRAKLVELQTAVASA